MNTDFFDEKYLWHQQPKPNSSATRLQCIISWIEWLLFNSFDYNLQYYKAGWWFSYELCAINVMDMLHIYIKRIRYVCKGYIPWPRCLSNISTWGHITALYHSCGGLILRRTLATFFDRPHIECTYMSGLLYCVCFNYKSVWGEKMAWNVPRN